VNPIDGWSYEKNRRRKTKKRGNQYGTERAAIPSNPDVSVAGMGI